MKILSVYPYTHLSSSALLIDGEIVAAAAEERFNREKMSTRFPNLSARWCLKKGNLDWKDLDMIVVPWNPMHNINEASGRWVNEMRWRGEMLTNVPVQLMRAINGPVASEMETLFGKTRLVYLDHHECHAANAFFLSGFEKADILTIDGHGEVDTCFMGTGSGTSFEKTGKVLYPHSLGLFYGTFTDFLGFRPDVDEWKVMALYSYSPKPGPFDDKVRSLVKLTEEGFELDLSYFDFYMFDRRPHFYHPKFKALFGESRAKDETLTERHYQIAGAMQRVFVEVVEHLLKVTRSKGGSDNIVLSGGAAMNCVLNGQLDSMSIYKDSFISSCPDDSGVSVGACLLAHYRFDSKAKRTPESRDNYWGPSFSDEEIAETISKFKLRAEKPAALYDILAQELEEGRLIGWFQDAMEFGHRALGNRSILADPRREETKDRVNAAVKYRESFRPFAPAVLAERAAEIFEMPAERRVRFMERAYFIKPDWRPRLGAVTHVDGTGRLQTVEEEIQPKFYRLIQAFEKRTGVPVLLNTSFNLNGEPIVMTPEHAVRTFYSCGLDTLVLGPYVIRK